MVKRIVLDCEMLYRRYLGGESENVIAKSLGVSRSVVKRNLLACGIARRGQSEAETLKWSRMTPEQRRVQVAAAHDAVRDTPQSEEHRCKIASGCERLLSNVSRIDRRCYAMLESCGLKPVLNKAIGRYNVDVALPESSIAVEIFGGYWHAAGSHATRFRKRFNYILDAGWTPVIIWVSRDYPLEFGAIEYIAALPERMRLDESLRSQEHVIRGDGEPSGIGKSNLDYRAVIGGDKTGELIRGEDGRFSNKAVRM